MANVVGRIVRSFQSLDYGELNTGNHASSVRRSLDTPRLLLNMMHTDDGYLWMPPAPTEFVTSVSGSGSLYLIRNTQIPDNYLIVQKGTTVSIYDLSVGSAPYSSADATYTLSADEKIWTMSFGSAFYFGNSAETVKVTSGPTVTDITDPAIPDGYHSIAYRSRRFVLERTDNVSGGSNNRLWYSDLADPETFPANNYIDIESYYEGDSWENALGAPVAMQAYGDFLAVFTSQGVIRFTGTDPETNFTLRPTLSPVGAWMRDSIVETPKGLMFFGGTPRGEFGYYLWTGNNSQLASRQLNGYLREWVEDSGQAFNEDRGDATSWRDRLIAAVDVDASPTLYVYDYMQQNWSTFDGWTRPTVGLARKDSDRLCVADSDETTIYSTTDPMFRATDTTPARFRVGYEDEDQPAGLVRYQEARLTVNTKSSSGTGITVKMDATVVNGTFVTSTQTISRNGQYVLRFPIKARGSAIDLDFTITPSATDHEMVVENLELVQSRKSLKVGRVAPNPIPLTLENTTYFAENDDEDTGTSGTVVDGFDVWDTITLTGTNIEEGDLLVLTAGADQYSGFTRTGQMEVPSGWTEVLSETYNGSTTTSIIAYKIADADDAAGSATYPIRIEVFSTGSQYGSWGGAWFVSVVKNVTILGGDTWVAGPLDSSPPYDDLEGTSPASGTGSLVVYNGTDRFLGGSSASDITFPSEVTSLVSNRERSGNRHRVGYIDPSTTATFSFTGGSGFGRPFVAFIPVRGTE